MQRCEPAHRHCRRKRRKQRRFSAQLPVPLASVLAIMLATPEKMLCLALALTAVLAIAPGQDPLLRWDRAHPAPAKPSWLPWLVLAGLAIASGFFGIVHPAEFAAAAGQEMPDPGWLLVAFGQP